MMYKEILVVRFNDKQDKIKTKMLSEGEFHYEFQKVRPTDPYWSTISSMQLAPFSRIGLGNILKFSFCPIQVRSHDLIPSDFKITNNSLNLLKFIPKMKEVLSNQLSNSFAKLNYDYKQFESKTLNEQGLMVKQPETYCLMQCYKIGYYLQQVHRIEIISMQVEFS